MSTPPPATVTAAAAAVAAGGGTETEEEAMQRAFKSMPDRASHLSFFHDGKRDWTSVKLFWSALIARNPIGVIPEPANTSAVNSTTSLHSTHSTLPPWVTGATPYGVTDIQAIHDCAAEEFLGYHARGDKKKGNKRKTFGLRIGYDGSQYQGYQSQGADNAEKGREGGGILTVEDDVKQALGGMSSMSAGRTDKDVSAISQVISCHTFDQSVTPASLRSSFQQSSAVRSGRLTLFDCAEVPKKFHALFSATWRRYLYLFPLHVRKKRKEMKKVPLSSASGKTGETASTASRASAQKDRRTEQEQEQGEGAMRWFPLRGDAITPNGQPATDFESSQDVFEIDVDIDHINALLHCLDGKSLSYNGFAYKDLQKTNRGALATRGANGVKNAHKCPSKVDETHGNKNSSVQPIPSSLGAEPGDAIPDKVGIVLDATDRDILCEEARTEQLTELDVEPSISVEEEQRALSGKVQIETLEKTEKQSEAESNAQKRYTSADAAVDKCTLLQPSAFIVDLTPYMPATSSGEDTNRDVKENKSVGGEEGEEIPKLAMCVELVGSRFLRRMVRILVATVIRECQLPQEERDEEVLLKICQLGLRDRSSMAITGEGLAMAGVGYDLQSLSVPKFGSTTTNPKKLRKKALKRAMMEQEEKEQAQIKRSEDDDHEGAGDVVVAEEKRRKMTNDETDGGICGDPR